MTTTEMMAKAREWLRLIESERDNEAYAIVDVLEKELGEKGCDCLLERVEREAKEAKSTKAG
jgi:hypothetical protein